MQAVLWRGVRTSWRQTLKVKQLTSTENLVKSKTQPRHTAGQSQTERNIASAELYCQFDLPS